MSELAVVVGASGALGGAIAARLLAEGLAVVGVARGGASDTPGGLEWCAADIGSDDAAAAIAEAVGGRPVRMVVQAPRRAAPRGRSPRSSRTRWVGRWR